MELFYFYVQLSTFLCAEDTLSLEMKPKHSPILGSKCLGEADSEKMTAHLLQYNLCLYCQQRQVMLV